MAQCHSGEILSFSIGKTEFTIAASDVAEVLRPPVLTRMPLSPASLLGVASLRGAVVPVVSLARLLGETTGHGKASSRVLLLHLDEPVGIAVDAVGSLKQSKADDAVNMPAPGQLAVQGDGQVRSLDLVALVQKEFAGLLRGSGRRARRSTAAESSNGAPPQETALLTFDIAGQSYALPLTAVSEAIAIPSEIASVLDSDPAMLGVIHLRGALLPVASLAALLGLPSLPLDGQTGRIVVVELGNARIGLAVDRLQTILRVPAENLEPVPSVLNRGSGEASIQSICRLPDGRGLVSVLSPERLFHDGSMAVMLADAGKEKSEMTPALPQDASVQMLIFQLGAEEYGLPVAAVSEVMRLPERLTRLPRGPDFVLGIVHHRGRALPVIDQRRCFGVPPGGTGDRRRLIVTAIGGLDAGLVVDGVSQILGLAPDQIRPAPELTAEGGRLFDRVADLGGDRLILLIEPRELLDRAERDMLTVVAAATSELSAP